MRMSFFETENLVRSRVAAAGCKTASKKLEKFLTKANEFDKINELLIERTAKKFERASKNKLKKFLTNEKLCDKINELIRVGTAEILDN